MTQGIIDGNVNLLRLVTKSINLGSTAANTTAVHTVTVDGLKTEDAVFVNKPSHSTGLGIVNARVSAVNTLEITTMNTTAGAIDPGAETYQLLIVSAP